MLGNLARSFVRNHKFALRIPSRSVTNSGHKLSVTVTREDTLLFDNHSVVYSQKKTSDLIRALFVLRLSSIDGFVDRSLQLFEWGQRLLGAKGLGLLLKPTFYKQFVAGEDEKELMTALNILHQQGVRLMMCPALEEDVGQAGQRQKYEDNLAEMKQLAEMTARVEPRLPMLQLKITSLMSADCLEIVTKQLISGDVSMSALVDEATNYVCGGRAPMLLHLEPKFQEEYMDGLVRLRDFASSVQQHNLRLLVDGEFTYLQPSIGLMGLYLMALLNKRKPIVCNTYQCYLQRTPQTLETERRAAQELGICFAAKVVRGAYLERERWLAKTEGYPDPTNPTYEATTATYSSVMDNMLRYVKCQPADTCYLVVGTNNEDSARLAVRRISDYGLDRSDGSVVFGQVYGMAEQVSACLAASGYIVYKSTPIGPLSILLPYLARRAAENRSVFHGSRRERQLLWRELRNRVFPWA